MRIKFMFDYGAINTCIWNNDPDTEYSGFLMPLDDFPLSEGLKADIIHMCEEFQTSLDWEYPPDPSPWTEEHKRDFAQRAKAAFDRLVMELGDGFEVKNGSNWW